MLWMTITVIRGAAHDAEIAAQRGHSKHGSEELRRNHHIVAEEKDPFFLRQVKAERKYARVMQSFLGAHDLEPVP